MRFEIDQIANGWIVRQISIFDADGYRKEIVTFAPDIDAATNILRGLVFEATGAVKGRG